jgi:hypothetical protein
MPSLGESVSTNKKSTNRKQSINSELMLCLLRYLTQVMEV